MKKNNCSLKNLGNPFFKLHNRIKLTSLVKVSCVSLIPLCSILAGNGFACAAGIVSPEKTPVSVSADLPFLSASVWRGQVCNNEPVFQPSLTVEKGDFSVNIFESVYLTGISTVHAPEATETDITFSYNRKIQSLAMTLGWAEYLYANQTISDLSGNKTVLPGTRELFVGAGFPELPGSPSITAFYDFKEIKGTYYTIGTKYNSSYDDGKIILGVSGSVGYGSAAYNKGYFGINRAKFNDVTLGVTASVAAADNLRVVSQVQYVTFPDSDIKNAAKSWYKDNQQVVYSLKLSYSL